MFIYSKKHHKEFNFEFETSGLIYENSDSGGILPRIMVQNSENVVLHCYSEIGGFDRSHSRFDIQINILLLYRLTVSFRFSVVLSMVSNSYLLNSYL